MTSLINRSALNFGNQSYYDEALLNIYQDYKTYFINHKSTRKVIVNEGILHRNENDPDGLILELQIPPIYGWFVLMINDLNNGKPLPQGTLVLSIPDFSELERIRSAYESSKTI